MTKKKLAIVVALAAAVALVALRAFATTDACIARVYAGPMVKNLVVPPTTTFTVYALHISSDDCDCNHTAATITVWWKPSYEETWLLYGSMTKNLTALCGLDEYYKELTLYSGQIIDLKAVDSKEPGDCQWSEFGWGIP